MKMGRRKTLRLIVSGRVQGVSYRAAVQNIAGQLGINGLAYNNPDGSVTIIAQGSPHKLADFVRQCYHGTTVAKVSDIKTTVIPDASHFQTFAIR